MPLDAHFLQAVGLNDFVVVDLETTGLDPTTDRIIEIGAVRFRDGVESEVYDTLINPGTEIPDFITKLTGITQQDVNGAPAIDDKFDELLAFIGDATLIGHQVNFDASFLEYHLRRRHNDFTEWDREAQRFRYLSNLRMDTLFLARIFLPFLERFKLGAVAAYFNIDLENAHRAIDDARATGQIFVELIERTLACDLKTLRQIMRLLYKNSARVKNYFQPIHDYKLQHNITTTGGGIAEDMTYAQQFYNVIGEADYVAEPGEYEIPAVPVDTDAVSAALGNDGRLARTIPNYEEREQQMIMAAEIAGALNEGQFLIAEAGTGTGKSMAYLLPAVEWAVQNRQRNERVVISTNTKNLQEQLFYKDIPTVFAATGSKFKAVLLKGKSNYLCLDKWHATLTDMDQRLSQQERSRILPLMLWAEQTRTGDIAENSGFQINQNWGLWGKLIAENNYCPGRSCKHYEECFLMKARNNARRADVVVVNHSLMFSDLITDNSILGEYHNLVVDEAHNLEKTAGEYLGVRFNWWSFRNAYHKLYEEEPRKAGALVQLEYRLSQVKLPPHLLNPLDNQIGRLKTESIAFKRTVNQFFTEFSKSLREQVQKKQGGGEENRLRYFKNFKLFREHEELIQQVGNSLNSVRRKLSELLETFNELRADTLQFQDQLHRELISIETDLNNLSESFSFCIDADQDQFVYWLDLPFRADSTDVTFNAVPLNIAELLKDRLFQTLNSAIFTSATLAVNGSFDYFRTRTGLNLLRDKTIHEFVLGSPFDYENQLLLAVADFMEDPRNERFSQQMADLIRETHGNHPTGMLVLFTSYSQLNILYDRLKTHFDGERILLLAQGKSGSRTNIINQFREYKGSVLFGTDSFWEGVDVPGEALELLLIHKLPFDVPSDPLIAARMEVIKKNGGNPFQEYSVPEAIIKFRQGFGRLIRHKQDFGAVIVCDNRVSRMQYGKQFLDSLPVQSDIFTDKESLFDALREWFARKKTVKNTEV